MSWGTQPSMRKFCPMDLEKRKPCRASRDLMSLMLQRSILYPRFSGESRIRPAHVCGSTSNIEEKGAFVKSGLANFTVHDTI